jgi:hypothetical protein
MSDAAAPAAPAAPAADAPVEGQPVAPVDPYADLDAAVKKAAPKYKVGGKEKTAGSFRELLRKAEMADGLQYRAQELSDRESKAAEVLDLKQRIRESKDSKERVKLLRELAGETFDEAAEEAILERIEREKSMQGLSATERQAREELAEARARNAKYEAAEKQAEADRQAKEDESEFNTLREHIAGVAVKALSAAGLPKEAAPDAGRRLAALIARAQQRGLPLQPEDLSEQAVKWAGDDFKAYTTPLDGEALIGFLGEAVVQKASRAWLARAQGGSATKAVVPMPKPEAAPQQRQRDASSPMAAWRELASGKLR